MTLGAHVHFNLVPEVRFTFPPLSPASRARSVQHFKRHQSAQVFFRGCFARERLRGESGDVEVEHTPAVQCAAFSFDFHVHTSPHRWHDPNVVHHDDIKRLLGRFLLRLGVLPPVPHCARSRTVCSSSQVRLDSILLCLATSVVFASTCTTSGSITQRHNSKCVISRLTGFSSHPHSLGSNFECTGRNSTSIVA